MSNFYVDGQITGPTFQKGFDLSSILVSIGNRQDNKVVKVQITEPGIYYLNRAIQFKCNLIIEGCEGAVIAVRYSSDSDYSDDCFLHFNYITKTVQGIQTYIRPNIIIKNIEFKIDGNHWWHSTYNRFYYLKFYWAESITIENVKMKLEGQLILTNVDMRQCENVVVNNCLLENYHNNTEQIHEGGILWIRGITRNYKIFNNIIKKSGNDEALGFFGHHSDSHNQSDPNNNYYEIPESEEPTDGICHKENIIVENNVFVYENHYSNTNTNDCLISIIDHDTILHPEQSQQGNTKFHIENIVFKNNEFVINDLCRRFIKCNFEDQIFLRNVVFKNNHFETGDFSVVDNLVSVFELINKYSAIDSKYDILGNSLYNKASIKVYENEPGLHFLTQIGGEVRVSKNSTRVCETLSGQLYRQIRFFKIQRLNSNATITDNDLAGIYLFASITSSNGSPVIDQVNLCVKNNIIKGDSRIYNTNVRELNISIEDNYIECEKDVIVLQNYGTCGNFCYKNNHVVSKFSGTPTFYYTNNGCNASRVCISNNIFENVTSNILTILNNYVSSSIRKEIYNIYLN